MNTNQRSGLRTVTRATAMTGVLTVVWGSAGCMTAPRLSVQAERYHLQLRMDPATHWLVGRTEMNLVCTGDDSRPAEGPVAVGLLLHPDLKITRVTASGATVKRHRAGRVKPGDADEFTPREHAVVLAKPTKTMTLFVDYAGELFQEVSAGEKPGQIHNFEMRAHIGEDGIYLGGGYWYPEPVADEEVEPRLAHYTVVADPVPGFELVAGAERDGDAEDQSPRLVWQSPYPLGGMVLVGGAHEVHRLDHNGLAVSVHLLASQAQHADGLIETVKRNLDRYEPLIGPYPAREYAVVDNFFSSGFAFPTFTLLSSAVINMGARSQTGHGYIDHEMLHCWWGNGIHVDPQDGNWCEALTSYATNYYGYVLDGDEVNARRKRRNFSHFLSRIEPEKDKPLGRYDREDGPGRGIGYNKGAMVFHMLARKVGQDTFWAAMRRFTKDYVGKYASWDDIQRVLEEESSVSLATFFHQWIRNSGAPQIVLERARYDSAEQALILALSQGEPTFDLDVPLRITHADGVHDIDVRLEAAAQEITVPVEVIPLTVEVDPDYHIFRKVPPGEIVPTTASTRRGTAFATVLPSGEVPESYTKLQSIFESGFEEDERRALIVGDIEEGELAERCVLIVGEAVRDPYVAAFLSAIEFPVRWLDDGFELADARYTDPGDGVLATAAHPGVPGGGVTVLFANSEEAIPNPMHMTFYDRSVVVFKDRRPKERRDLEPRNIVTVDKL